MFRNGHPASLLARHVTTIGRANEFETKHVPVAKTVWGPLLWSFFHGLGHLLAMVKDPKNRNSFSQQFWVLMKDIIETIPCPYCRVHALDEYKDKKFLENAEIPDTYNSFQMYFFEFHNRVNTRLHKENYTVEMMREFSRHINVEEKMMGYFRAVNGYRIWKRRDEFLAKFNRLLSELKKTLWSEATLLSTSEPPPSFHKITPTPDSDPVPVSSLPENDVPVEAPMIAPSV